MYLPIYFEIVKNLFYVIDPCGNIYWQKYFNINCVYFIINFTLSKLIHKSSCLIKIKIDKYMSLYLHLVDLHFTKIGSAVKVLNILFKVFFLKLWRN